MFCSPESQPCPEVHQKQCGQEVEGGDSVPLLCSSETSPEVLCPLWGPQHKDVVLLEEVQRRVTKQIRGVEHLSCEDRLRDSGCSAQRRNGSRESLKHHFKAFQYLKGKYEKDWDRPFISI